MSFDSLMKSSPFEMMEPGPGDYQSGASGVCADRSSRIDEGMMTGNTAINADTRRAPHLDGTH
jgi:hypothetical protein